MEALKKIAFYRGTNSDVPNQELARELVDKKDHSGIKEIFDNLSNSNPAIQSDCIKILYEVGYNMPELITDYTDDFLSLLSSKNNRLNWGTMITLSTLAELEFKNIYNKRDAIIYAIENGSVITIDAGIKTLSIVASKDDSYRQTILPYLFRHLKNCRAKDVPQHCEQMKKAVDRGNKSEFISLLESRLPEMTPPQMKRIKKVIKNFD